MELHITATGCHFTNHHMALHSVNNLPPDTSEHARLNPAQAGRYSIYLPGRDGRL